MFLRSFKSTFCALLVLMYIFNLSLEPVFAATTFKKPSVSEKQVSQKQRELSLGEDILNSFSVHSTPSPSSDNSSLALSTGSSYTDYIFGENVPDPVSNLQGFKGDYDTQLSTGASTYRYDFELPPGRGGLSPSLSLQYVSQSSNEDSFIGYGWDLSESYIERSDRKGVDTMYSRNEFRLVLSGIGSEIVPISLSDPQKGYGEYGESISQYFWKYTFNNDDSWMLIDKSGTRYLFGKDESSQMFDPSNGSKIYRWYLEEARDTNDNYIRYEYLKDNNRLYPKKILYTGHGANQPSNDGPFRIEFVLKERTDQVVSYRPGFRVLTRYVIDEVQVYIDEFAITDPVRIYDLEYTTSDNGKKSLLSNITETGTAENGERKSLPPTTFEYYKNDPQKLDWKLDPVTYPTSLSCSSDTILLDVNLDGYDDILRSYLYKQSSNDPFQSYSYAYTNKKNGTFEIADNSFALPEPLASYNELNQVIDSNVFNFFDFNGDLPTDLGEGEAFSNTSLSPDEHVYFLKENGWQKGPGYSAIEGWMQYSSSTSDLGTRNFDVNGDSLTDLVRGYQKTSGAFESSLYLNDPELKNFVPSTTYKNDLFPFAHEGGYGNYDPGFRLTDVNGDGLSDVVYSFYEMNNIFDESDTAKYSKVYLNNGSNGWVEDPSWKVPVAISYTFQTDINSVCENDPEDGPWFDLIPQSRYFTGVYFLDVNGDHLQDIVVGNDSASAIKLNCTNRNLHVEPSLADNEKAIYLNNGVNGWDKVSQNFDIPTFVYHDYIDGYISFQYDKRIHIAEMNGDSIADVLLGSGGCPLGSQVSGNYFASQARSDTDLLHFVRNSHGGSIELLYEPSTQHKDDSGNYLNRELPITLQIVKEVKLDDGLGDVHSIQYQYKNGRFFTYSPTIREFAGFETVTSNDGQIVTKTTFSQGSLNNAPPSGDSLSSYFSLKGKPLRTEIFDLDGSKLSETIQKWEAYDFGGLRFFPKLVQNVTLDYEGGLNPRGSASTFIYDNATGNLIETRNYGEVVYDTATSNFTDIGNDAIFAKNKYADNASVWIFGLPTEETFTDASGNKKAQNRYYYDGLKSIGQVSKGNLTKIAKWLDTDNVSIYTQYQYDVYGNKTRVARSNRIEEDEEAFDHATYFEYDTELHMYPDRIINPEGYETLLRYDLFSGSVKKTVDPNNTTFEYEYDPFYRLKQVKVNDPENYAVLKTKTEYVYDDLSVPTNITLHAYDGVSLDPVSTSYYFDGFQRKIQIRTEAEDSNYTINDIQYNELDQITKESLPYFGSGSSYQTPLWNNAYTAYEYDALSRPRKVSFVKSTSEIFSETTYDYSTPWQTVIFDPEGNPKIFRYDAFHRLIEVDEYLTGLKYTTRYFYDVAGNLIKIVDSKNNERSFQYDSLSRLIETTETHAASDLDVSSWRFFYDDNDNLAKRVDPNGTVTTFTYDMLDRVKTESSGSSNIAYEYDRSRNSIGRISSVTADTSFSGYEYDDLGNLQHETKIVLDTEFVTSFQTDLLGRVRSITYPETTRIDYAYHEGGLLESVSKFGVNGSQTLVSNIDYSPLGQITRLDYGDGTSKTQTFEMNEMYRLKTASIKHGSLSIQDFQYSYDKVGNILSISDGSDTDTEKLANFEYDDLYRLTRAFVDYGDIDGDDRGSHSTDYDETYQYDSIGNMTYKFGIGNFTYNGPNSFAPSSAGTYSFTYDDNGNLVSDGLRTLSYNHRNQIVQTNYNNLLTYLDYDSSGSRVLKESFRTRNYYPNKYYELYEDGNGLKSLAHIYAGDLRIAFLEIDSPKDADKDGIKTEDGDCYDYDASIYPGALEVCDDGIDQNCDGADTLCRDLDSDTDGYTGANGDCNDNNASIHPLAQDICDDGIDQDCSGYDLPCNNADRDNDGYTSLSGDCKDDDASIHPNAPELCNNIDDDCNGEVDDGLTFDLDSDGYQSRNSCSGSQNDCNDVDRAYHPDAFESCSTDDFNCDGSNQSCLDRDDDADSWTEAEGDCDDANPLVHPNNNEIERNSLDDDCDSSTLDDDLDQDGYASDFDCNDESAAIYPYAPEWTFPCEDGIDQDCDGYDLGCDSLDLDLDGYSADDCNDLDPAVHPDAIEIAYDGIDNDCDILTLDDDLDRDDYGKALDCDDNNRSRWPGNDEICGDQIDQNCDNEDLSCDVVDQDLDGYTPQQGDCNDARSDINPGAFEKYYDGIDNDCNPLTVDDDKDADSYPFDSDCDDNESSVYPGAHEICGDQIDQDCNQRDRFCFEGFDIVWPNIISNRFKVKTLPSQQQGFSTPSSSLETLSQSQTSISRTSESESSTARTSAPSRLSLPSPIDVSQRLFGLNLRDKTSQLFALKRDTFQILLDLIYGKTFQNSRFSDSSEAAFNMIEGNSRLFYVFADHLGSTSVIMDSAGDLVNVKDYKPFGTLYVDQYFMSEPPLFPYSFTGKEYDEEMDLYYFEARYLNDALARFTSVDSALFDMSHLRLILSDPQALNAYSYARNNPMRLVDPDGAFWKEVFQAGKEAIQATGEFIGAAAQEFFHNQTYGLVPAPDTSISLATQLGAETGRMLSEAASVASMIVGGTIATGGAATGAALAVTSAGILIPVGVAVSAESIAAGAALAGQGAGTLMYAKSRSENIGKATMKINFGQQGKHIPGHNNFQNGKSVFTHANPKALFEKFSGKGQPLNNFKFGEAGYKERVDFGEVIGNFIYKNKSYETTRGIIHYGENGAHIVPARPANF